MVYASPPPYAGGHMVLIKKYCDVRLLYTYAVMCKSSSAYAMSVLHVTCTVWGVCTCFNVLFIVRSTCTCTLPERCMMIDSAQVLCILRGVTLHYCTYDLCVVACIKYIWYSTPFLCITLSTLLRKTSLLKVTYPTFHN
jgi:hypothetical protein